MSDRPVLVPSRPAGAPFACTRTRGRGGAAWFHLAGELDLSVASSAAARLREAQAVSALVVADLRDLEFIDCAGLGVLVAAANEARSRRRSFVVLRGTGQVDRLMQTAGLLRSLEIVDLRGPSPEMRDPSFQAPQPDEGEPCSRDSTHPPRPMNSSSAAR